jgi:uncharacterized protein YegJ (DUF2314 family)
MRWSWSLSGSLLLGVLAAQTPPVPDPVSASKPAVVTAVEPQPAITLLLQSERRLDADRLRRRWARLIGEKVGKEVAAEGAFLAGDGAEVVGVRDGVRWRLRSEPAPHPLPAAAVQHLDDDDAGQLRTHGAQLLVRAEAAPADAASRTRCYRVLAGVAAALLGRDVVGIGAAAHGTFDAFDGDVEDLEEDLLGDDPLAALAPSMATSLVAFLAAERKLDQAELEQALGKEFGVSFAEPKDGSDSENFVVVREDMAVVRVGDDMLFLELDDARNPPPADLENYQDLRIRRLLGDHRQLLRVMTQGPIGPAAESARRVACARVIAALWHDEVLGLSWHCDRRLIPSSVDVPKQLRSEDPVAATLGERVVPVLVPPDEAVMQRAIEQARATWGQAVAQHRQGGEVSAKFPFPTRTGNVEHIWINVQKIEGEQVHGVLANEPHDLGDWKLGTAVTAKVADLSDWLFLRDGEMVGGYTVKALAAKPAPMPESKPKPQPQPQPEAKPEPKPKPKLGPGGGK